MSVTDIIRDINALEPKMLTRVKLFLTKLEKENISIVISESRRSLERQKWLYAQGRTRPGAVVTWTLKSKHIDGLAIDVAFLINGKASYNGDWQALGKIGESCGLAWGGRWTTPDKPHFEFNPNIQDSMISNETQQSQPVEPHWAEPAEQYFIGKGYVTDKKDLNAPLTRGEFYVILQRLLKDKGIL